MFGFLGNIGPWELGLVLLIVLIIFGPGKLPALGESVGKAIKGFRKSQEDDDKVDELVDKAETAKE